MDEHNITMAALLLSTASMLLPMQENHYQHRLPRGLAYSIAQRMRRELSACWTSLAVGVSHTEASSFACEASLAASGACAASGALSAFEACSASSLRSRFLVLFGSHAQSTPAALSTWPLVVRLQLVTGSSSCFVLPACRRGFSAEEYGPGAARRRRPSSKHDGMARSPNQAVANSGNEHATGMKTVSTRELPHTHTPCTHLSFTCPSYLLFNIIC